MCVGYLSGYPMRKKDSQDYIGEFKTSWGGKNEEI
jgi:hypothetical protein